MTLRDRGGGSAERYVTPKIICMYNIYYNFYCYVCLFIYIYTSIITNIYIYYIIVIVGCNCRFKL